MTAPAIEAPRPRHGDRSKVRSLSPEQLAAVRVLATDLGSRVRSFRLSLGLTQGQFGARYGVSKERINHIERVTRPNLSFGTAIRMLDDIGCELSIVPKVAA